MRLEKADVRISKKRSQREKKLKAAKKAVSFIVASARATKPDSKFDLIQQIWMFYFDLHNTGLLVASRMTRRRLKARFGTWAAVGVDPIYNV